MQKKKILLTNDDGIHAPGIKALHDFLCETFDITVVAPDCEKSGVSHSFTYNKHIFYEKITDSFSDNMYSVSGSPADCVKIAVTEILNEMPDMIISGMNIGENSGICSYYSGTVAAAREGHFWKIKSFAFSICEEGRKYLDKYIRYVPEILDKIILLNSEFLNINFPACNPLDLKGIKVTRQSLAFFNDSYISTNVIENDILRKGYKINGTKVGIEKKNEYDSRALIENWITITPMTVDATDYSELNKLKEHEHNFRGIVNV